MVTQEYSTKLTVQPTDEDLGLNLYELTSSEEIKLESKSQEQHTLYFTGSYTEHIFLKSTKLINSEGDNYYGQLNEKDKKHGYGCCIFADGSYYEG